MAPLARPAIRAHATLASPPAWFILAGTVLVSIFTFVDHQVSVRLAEAPHRWPAMAEARVDMLLLQKLALLAVFGAMPLAMLAARLDKRLVFAGHLIVWSRSATVCGLPGRHGMLMSWAIQPVETTVAAVSDDAGCT